MKQIPLASLVELALLISKRRGLQRQLCCCSPLPLSSQPRGPYQAWIGPCPTSDFLLQMLDLPHMEEAMPDASSCLAEERCPGPSHSAFGG